MEGTGSLFFRSIDDGVFATLWLGGLDLRFGIGWSTLVGDDDDDLELA